MKKKLEGKAFFTQGKMNEKLHMYNIALDFYQKALNCDKKNKEYKKACDSCRLFVDGGEVEGIDGKRFWLACKSSAISKT